MATRKQGRPKGTTTRSKPKTSGVREKVVYKYRTRQNPKGLGDIKLNEALMVTAGVVLVNQLPNIVIRFFGQAKITKELTDSTGQVVSRTNDKSKILIYQIGSIIVVYFLADTLRLKGSNKDALISGMIAGLVLQFVEQMLFSNKMQYYGYLNSQMGQVGNQTVIPVSNRQFRNRLPVPQTSGYLDQLGDYPRSRTVSIPLSRQTAMRKSA